MLSYRVLRRLRRIQVSKCISCIYFPCSDVNHQCYIFPNVEAQPQQVYIAVIAEASPPNLNDYYYSKGDPLFQRTTVQAFNEAGYHVASVKDILDLGVYLTTAVKCGKTGYAIKATIIEECSQILEQELKSFPNLRVLMLMGDVAIKSVNYVAKRAGERRVIPAGSTYKIRSGEYCFQGKRVFPSYLQAGSSFFIEKSKRKMIVEDIARALSLLK